MNTFQVGDVISTDEWPRWRVIAVDAKGIPTFQVIEETPEKLAERATKSLAVAKGSS